MLPFIVMKDQVVRVVTAVCHNIIVYLFVPPRETSAATTPSSVAFPYGNEGSIGSAGKGDDCSLSLLL